MTGRPCTNQWGSSLKSWDGTTDTANNELKSDRINAGAN